MFGTNRTVLRLGATLDVPLRDQNEMLRAAKAGSSSAASCIVTKVDEGANLGTACTWLRERQLALAWLGIGQRVTEDLAAPSGSALVRWLVAA